MAGLAPSGVVHIGWSGVAQACAEAGPVSAWMTDAERIRLACFARPARQAQFTAGRWVVRRLLADLLGDAAGAWRFTAPSDGPPRLIGPPAARRLHASVSHSGDRLACAVADVPVGIDVETHRRPGRDWAALAQAVCSAGELDAFHRVPAADRPSAFHALWTLKEAWLKCHGEGVTPGRMAQLHAEPSASEEGRLWQMPGTTLALYAPAATTCTGMPRRASAWRISDRAAS